MSDIYDDDEVVQIDDQSNEQSGGESSSDNRPFTVINHNNVTDNLRQARVLGLVTACEGQASQNNRPGQEIYKDGIYVRLSRDSLSGDPVVYIGITYDNFTCEEARQCMNKSQLTYAGVEGGVARYSDAKNRNLGRLLDSIVSNCKATSPGSTPPPSTDDEKVESDFMGGQIVPIVIIAFVVAMMAIMYYFLRK